MEVLVLVAGGESMLRRDFGRSFCPTAEFTYRITLAKTNGTLSMVIPEHTITCIPTLALQTTATETPSKYGFNLVTGSAKQFVWGYAVSVEHNPATYLHCDQKHAETRSEP